MTRAGVLLFFTCNESEDAWGSEGTLHEIWLRIDYLSFIFRKSQNDSNKCQSKHNFDSQRFPDICGNIAGNAMISGERFIDVLIPSRLEETVLF